MGRVGGLHIMEGEEDITERLLAADPSWGTRLFEMNRTAERMLLQGPADEDVETMRGEGYAPEVAEAQIATNATLEAVWSQRIRQHLPARRLRDLVLARHLSLELLDMIVHELFARQIGIEDIFEDPEGGARFVMSMPSSAVTVSMKAQYHQDPNRSWSANDIYDIDALAVTIPYCDVVFADASARGRRNQTRLGQAFPDVPPTPA